jgi:hypothetical protein
MESKRTALLITYYWPPGGGPGVHRWLRFSRFFKQNGWDLHVYCPQDAEWPIIDPMLEQSVSKDLTIVRRTIFEPHKYLGKKNNPNVGGGLTRAKKSSLFQRFVIWVRGNFFVPDARVFWIKPSARFLNTYLEQHPEIDTVISTGPPHSMHVIAQLLKQKHPQLTWVADFRDPWTEIDFYQELMTGASADRRQKKLEKGVLTGADLVISISEDCADGLARIGGRKVEIVTNGFVFPEFDAKAVKTDEQFTIAHFGSMSFPRNPEVLWKVLAQLLPDHAGLANALKIRLIGPVDINVIERVRHYGLESYLELIPNVSHGESLDMQRTTQVLLLVANKTPNVKGILTGKFFEYLGAKRPILTIGEKDSNLEAIVHETQCGVFADYDDEKVVADTILEWFAAYQNGQLYKEPVNTSRFSSPKIVEQLLGLIEAIKK